VSAIYVLLIEPFFDGSLDSIMPSRVLLGVQKYEVIVMCIGKPCKNIQQVCSTCKGFGHDKGGRPVVKFEDIPHEEREPGGPVRRHTTLKQGSGCISCLGVGYTTKGQDNV
jgi:hypothetical protein